MPVSLGDSPAPFFCPLLFLSSAELCSQFCESCDQWLEPPWSRFSHLQEGNTKYHLMCWDRTFAGADAAIAHSSPQQVEDLASQMFLLSFLLPGIHLNANLPSLLGVRFQSN